MRMLAARLLPYVLAFLSSLCIMVLELVASRLVAQHVGGSLIVWTSVIGVILAGICLGNVLGGRLADRMEPRMALGPLYGAGSALVIACLWVNAFVGLLPGLDEIPWDARTFIVVTLDFLVPATVLGMISPVVAKIAVDQAAKSGSALGDVYFWGAVGSIVGTFIAGFYLLYIAPTSTIVTVVAAALAVLAALLPGQNLTRLAALACAACLAVGSLESMKVMPPLIGFSLGNIKVNAVTAAGHVLAFVMGLFSLGRLWALDSLSAGPKVPRVEIPGFVRKSGDVANVSLRDLALLSFLSSLGFMTLEMVAGRLVTRHMGSSIFGWTSVIGILLGGLSIGNWLGGKLADRTTSPRRAGTLFLFASLCVLAILLMETPPRWLVRNPIGYFFGGEPPEPLAGGSGEFLGRAIHMTGYPWWFRVLFWTGLVFLVPAISMGTVGPVVAKLAVDRVRASGQTGKAIGSVYAWGMVGSILGTFLTGFALIDWFGTKGVILMLATMMALAATALGSIWHAAWAGVPLGLCVIAFAPAVLPEGKVLGVNTGAVRNYLSNQGLQWGLKDDPGDPLTADGEIAYTDESNYYFIKVNNESSAEGRKRTLVLDNLIHGYILLGKPKHLEYDYEHIYALVTHRLMKSRAEAPGRKANEPMELGVLFLGGGSYTFPRYLQATYPRTWAEVAEIDPAVTRANHMALGLPWPEPRFPRPGVDPKSGEEVIAFQRQTLPLGAPGSSESRENYLRVLDTFFPRYERDEDSGQARVWLDGESVQLGEYESPESKDLYIQTLARWFEDSAYRIRTVWGDARQYAVKHQDKTFDVIYGDAFNDFSVPWHLTTKEFNDLLANTLAPDGVYMINIIDVYESDKHAASEGAMLELSKRVTRALRGRWAGQKDLGALGRDVADFAAGLELRERWETLGDAVERVLEQDSGRLTVEALEREDRARKSADEPELPSVQEAEASVRAVLLNARAAEVLEALDDIRTGIIRRIKTDDPSNQGVVVAVDVINAARDQASKLPRPGERAEDLERLLRRCAETAETVAQGEPDEVAERIDALRAGALTDFEKKAISPERAKVVLDVLDGIRRATDLATEGSQADDATKAALGRRVAMNAASRLATELNTARTQLAPRAKSIEDRARGDEALAESVAEVIAGFVNEPGAWYQAAIDSVHRARQIGMFVGAWVNTAKLTFGDNIHVFGTDAEPGSGDRETFVIVASKQKLDLSQLGARPGDPEFYEGDVRTMPSAYGGKDMEALLLRSKGIVLTDDYAPVDNLLAPVAETRARD